MEQEEIGQSLLGAFAQVPDRRSLHGRRHPLPAILALATAAMLSGARSLYAIAQWGRTQPPEVVRALGFTRERTPAVATLHYTFKSLDVEAFEQALQRRAEADLLALVRAHWRIENSVHYVRDVTLGEDASTVRTGVAPHVLAALRNAVLGLLHRRRWRNIVAALRHDAWRPATHVLRLLGIHLS